jgi:hypothetical protein
MRGRDPIGSRLGKHHPIAFVALAMLDKDVPTTSSAIPTGLPAPETDCCTHLSTEGSSC